MMQQRTSQAGTFQERVRTNLLREVGPTAATAQLPAPQQIPDPFVYLERFGHFADHPELGFVAFALAHALRASWLGDFRSATDTLALLFVGLEQANLDQGAWDLAWLYLLLPDPPAEPMSRRTQSSELRQFPRSADQTWCTTMLAFISEMDLISRRRQEVTTQRPRQPRRPPRAPTQPASPQDQGQGGDTQPSPKARGRKGK